jgi:hypothetical protein
MSADTVATDLVIPFPLDEEIVHAVQPLIYRPWGTRTVKLKITTRADMPRLWVRPQAVLSEESALGICQARADDSRAFRITWGGGHERGPCVKSKDMLSAFETCAPLPAGDASYLYFNLTHAGAELPTSASVTFRAFECLPANGGSREADRARLHLPIGVPPDLPQPEEIIRIVPDGTGGVWTASSGRYLPRYDSRWWPAVAVGYEPSARPPLTLRIIEGALLLEWDGPGNTIAAIEDNTRPSVLLLAETMAFELFAFDPWSVALRVWFFWVDKYVGRGAFVGRHEVPDAERFDMIIRRTDGRVLLAGTDLHWRELWARVLPGKTLRATLGVSRDTAIKLAREKWSDAWNEIWARPGAPSDPAADRGLPHNPVEPYIRRLAEREATVTVKAGGTEAHVPTLHNVEQRRPPAMTSSDVRLG